MKLCVVISTLGKTDRLPELLDSLVGQSRQDFFVGICDQSEDGSARAIARRYEKRLKILVVESPRGLSRGRNAVMLSAPNDITHFIFPNDTSILPSTLIEQITVRHHSHDLIAIAYRSGSRLRYSIRSESAKLDRKNVWRVMEGAMILSARSLARVGLFDESLGTGSETKLQSGEGTDLLLRLAEQGVDCYWDSEIVVQGVPQEYGLSREEGNKKLRAYGRGYGYLHVKWKFGYLALVRIVVGPIVRGVRGRTKDGLISELYSSWGRLDGIRIGLFEPLESDYPRLDTA